MAEKKYPNADVQKFVDTAKKNNQMPVVYSVGKNEGTYSLPENPAGKCIEWTDQVVDEYFVYCLGIMTPLVPQP